MLDIDLCVEFLQQLIHNPVPTSEVKNQIFGDVLGQLAKKFSVDAIVKATMEQVVVAQRNHRWTGRGGAYPSSAAAYYGTYGSQHSGSNAIALPGIESLTRFLIHHIANDPSGHVRDLVLKMGAEIVEAGHKTVEILGLPFLKILFPEVRKLGMREYSNMYLTMLTGWSRDSTGQEPIRLRDWSRTASPGNCQDCRVLNTFLTDPNLKSAFFVKFNQERKRHLQSYLEQRDCEWVIDRTPSPQAILATKTENDWTVKHDNWQKNCRNVITKIGELGDAASLASILGPERCADIIKFKGLKACEQARQPPPHRDMQTFHATSVPSGGRMLPCSRVSTPLQQRPIPNTRMPTVAGVKRSHAQSSLDVVDLTGE